MNPNNPQPASSNQPLSQPTLPQQPYEAHANKPSGLAIASLVLSIIGLLTAWIFGIGILLGIVAMVLGIISLVKKRSGKGMSIAGIIISGITILFGIILVPIIIIAYAGIQNRAETTMIQESSYTVKTKAEAYNAITGDSNRNNYPTYDELVSGTDIAPEAKLDSTLISKLHEGGKSSVSATNQIAYKGCSEGAYIFYYQPADDEAGSYSVGEPSRCGF